MPSRGPVKVLIVDDHIGIRNGIASLMNAEWPRISCVGAVATADETLRLAQERQPHVVVLDVNLAGDDGLALIPLLQSLTPCQIVVLTSLSDPHVAARAKRLEIVRGASHLFEEAGTLEEAARLAGEWFLAHLDRAEEPPNVTDAPRPR